MGAHISAFLGVAALVIVTPGPDTALVTRNALFYGRRAALATSFGVNSGLLIWTLASALGVAAVVHASATAFTAMKLIGAGYLIWLGLRALRVHPIAVGSGILVAEEAADVARSDERFGVEIAAFDDGRRETVVMRGRPGGQVATV